MLAESIKSIVIFYIDDVSYNFDYLKQFLKASGHRGKVYTATNFSIAIQMVNSIYQSGEKIDLFVSDFNLPDHNAPWFISKVRSFSDKRLSEIPIIVLSNEQDKVKLTSAIVAGADAVIEKPFAHGEMELKMLKVIEKRSNKSKTE